MQPSLTRAACTALLQLHVWLVLLSHATRRVVPRWVTAPARACRKQPEGGDLQRPTCPPGWLRALQHTPLQQLVSATDRLSPTARAVSTCDPGAQARSRSTVWLQ